MSKVEEIRKHLEDGWIDFSPDQVRQLLEVIDSLANQLDRGKSSVEHSNVHYGKDEFIGIDGYGPYSLQKICKERWEIKMGHEKVILYNRKGKRVRGEIDNHENKWDGDW